MHNLNLQLNKNTLQQVFSLHDKRDLTIDCVLEGTMCNVTVDCHTSPEVFLIQNGPFYILGGDSNNPKAESLLDIIPCGAVILPSPLDWIAKLEKKSNVTLQKHERFSLNHENISIAHLDEIITSKPSQLTVKRIDASLACEISQDENFKYHFQNFKSESDFLNRGLGYVAIKGGLIVGVASSALVCSRGYEISIMVLPENRGKHFGKVLAAYLVREILSRNKIAHWDAANNISLNLAKQLGYDFKDKYHVHSVTKI